jgi:hypothetical protein
VAGKTIVIISTKEVFVIIPHCSTCLFTHA